MRLRVKIVVFALKAQWSNKGLGCSSHRRKAVAPSRKAASAEAWSQAHAPSRGAVTAAPRAIELDAGFMPQQPGGGRRARRAVA